LFSVSLGNVHVPRETENKSLCMIWGADKVCHGRGGSSQFLVDLYAAGPLGANFSVIIFIGKISLLVYDNLIILFVQCWFLLSGSPGSLGQYVALTRSSLIC